MGASSRDEVTLRRCFDPHGTNRWPEPTDAPTLIDSRVAGGSRAVPASVIHHKPSHAQPRLAIVPFAWIVGRRKPHST